jgi:Flp pilus assembly protein TadD
MFRKVLTLKPQEAQAHGGLGYSLYLQGRMSDAEVSIRRAVEIEPENKRYRNNLALVLARSGKNKEALEEYIRSGCTAIEAQNNLSFRTDIGREYPRSKKTIPATSSRIASSCRCKSGIAASGNSGNER